MSLSSFGKRVLSAYLMLLVLDVIVIALAARVNIWQEFFFVADLFPLGLSIVTLVLFLSLLLSGSPLKHTFVSRPSFHIGVFGLLSIFWLAFNAFSTSRWRNIPFPCSSIPSDYADERGWCQEVQALKAFVWILFVGVFLTTVFVSQHTFAQHRHGNRQVWRSGLMHFDARSSAHHGHARVASVTAGYFGASAPSFIPGVDSKW